MTFVVKKQTNMFFLTKNNQINCYSDFDVENASNELKLNCNGCKIIEIYFIHDNTKLYATYAYNPYKTTKQTQTEFKHDSFYTNISNSYDFCSIEIPKNINKCILRVIFKPFDNNTAIYKYTNDQNHFEVSCLPFFPSFICQDLQIESIFAHSDEYNVCAPGIQTKKDIRKNLIISSFVTDSIFHIPFSIGTFKLVDLMQGNIKIQIYLPNKFYIDKELRQDLLNIFTFILEFTHKEELNIKIFFTYRNMCTFSENTLYLPISIFPMEGIDQNIKIRQKIIKLASRMTYIKNTTSEFWLFIGLREYLKCCITRVIFGENEVLYKTKEDLIYVTENDINEPPLIKENGQSILNEKLIYYEKKLDPSAYFKKIKSRLFFHVLENNLSKAFLQKICFELYHIEKISTTTFIKIIKDITGKDFKAFFNFYVCNSGIVQIDASYDIDRKGKVEVVIKQKPTSIRKNCNKRYFGDLKLKIAELEGIYEHKFVNDKIIFQCHMRNKKRKTEKDINNEKNENKDDVVVEQLSENINPLQYLRIDPNIEHMIKVNLAQPDFMYIEQLLTDKNVISQYEAILALKQKPSENAAIAFEKILNDPHAFYKIYILILSTFGEMSFDEEANKTQNEKQCFGFQKIINFFSRKYFVPMSTIPKPIDINSYSSYLVQNSIAPVLTFTNPEEQKKYNDRYIKNKNITSAFLLNILKYNCVDERYFYQENFTQLYNQTNISNTNYMAGVILNLSYPICSQSPVDVEPFIIELERRRINDLVFPSYQNLITVSIIKFYMRLCFFDLIKLDYKILLFYTANQNFISVREAAIQCLIFCFFEESFTHIKNILFNEEREIKMYILSCYKSIIEIGTNNHEISDEYTNLFNDINTNNGGYNFFIIFERKYKNIYKQKQMFYDLLSLFYYDFILVEYITDIIYGIEGCYRQNDPDEDDTDIIEDNYVIRFKINNVILFPINTKAEKNELRIKRTKSQSSINLKPEKEENEHNPYKIKFTRCDYVNIKYDDFVLKTFKNIDDYIKKYCDAIKNEADKKKMSKTEKQSEITHKNKETNDESIKATKINRVQEFHNTIIFNYAGKLILDFDFNAFVIFYIAKNVKKHKYTHKLNIKANEKLKLPHFMYDLHKQFVKHYVTQKHGSPLYLNAKALETYIEGLYLDINPFTSLIPMTEQFINITANIINFINTLESIEFFKSPVKYQELGYANYIDIVRFPIDLEYIQNKFFNSKYHCFDVFVTDIEKLFTNCLDFNDINSDLYKIGLETLIKVRKFIIKEFNENICTSNEINIDENLIQDTTCSILESCEKYLVRYKDSELVFTVLIKILNELKLLKESAHYVENVDISETSIIIKKPMCINKMIQKLENREYLSFGHVFGDISQIVRNCTIINGNSAWIVRVAKKMENCFKKEMSLIFSIRDINVIKEQI
ncbi:Transcription initiation factor TFIID subunit 2 [Binucleata daphniae]